MSSIPRIFQVHIADGFVEDCEELLRCCSKFKPLTIEAFTNVWMEMNMSSIYQERTVGAEVAELSEEVIQVAKRYMVANTSNFEESVAGLFLVHGLLSLQPFGGFAALRVLPADVPALRRIDAVARRERRLDVLYVLSEVLARGPVQFHAELREYGFEPSLRKYLEGCTSIDRPGSRPRGVFYRQNEELDVISELVSTTQQYEDAKASISNKHVLMDLNYAQKNLPMELDASLKKIANGDIYEHHTNGESSKGDMERGDLVRDIKARAMASAVGRVKHLAALPGHDHAHDGKAESPNTSPQKKKDIRSKAGKVKSGSPKKPVTTGKRKRGRLNKKKSKSKRRKKHVSSSSSDEQISDFKDSDDEVNLADKDEVADLNTDDFHRVVIEVADSNNSTQEPDIEELVEKEYDIHIDTIPIVIRGCTSQNLEIEFIDQYENKVTDFKIPGTTIDVKQKVMKLTDISLTKVNEKGKSSSTEDNQEPGSSKQYEPAMASISKVKSANENYKLRKPEKRELKKPILKSKFKKLGLEPLANFDESKRKMKKPPKDA